MQRPQSPDGSSDLGLCLSSNQEILTLPPSLPLAHPHLLPGTQSLSSYLGTWKSHYNILNLSGVVGPSCPWHRACTWASSGHWG